MNLTGHITYIKGRNAGLPKLTMRMQVKNNFDTALTVLSADAIVYATVGNYAGINEAAHFLGPATVEILQNQIGKGAEATWDVGLPIAHHLLLQKIEQLRRGRDLLLLVQIRAVVAVTDPADRTRYGPFISTTVNSDSHSTAHCVHRIPRSDWLPLLSELGYGDYYLIEVPLRGVPQRADLKKALNHLTGAWDHFNQGSDAETLGSCYKSFERIALDSGAAQPDQNGWEKVLKGVDAKKREKLRHLLHHLSGFMHLGRHEPRETPEIGIDHADAEYAVILTQASLAYLAKLWSLRAGRSEPGNPAHVSDKKAPRQPRPQPRTLEEI
jgi:hypothetical protein